MGETAEERERRLARLARQITINSGYGSLGDLVINNLQYNPCAEIMLTPSHLSMLKQSQLRANPLVKFTKFKFKFSDEV